MRPAEGASSSAAKVRPAQAPTWSRSNSFAVTAVALRISGLAFAGRQVTSCLRYAAMFVSERCWAR